MYSPLNNDNVISRIEINNVNDNVSSKEKKIDLIVDNIMRKLKADESSRKWYCKVAWHLNESIIYSNLEIALKGNNQQKYFTWLCKRSMK